MKGLALKVGSCGALCCADRIGDVNLELNEATAKDLSLGAELRSGAAALCHSYRLSNITQSLQAFN